MGSANDDQTLPFPPGSWLGFGIDMISNTPTSISSVTKSILQGRRLVNLNTTGQDETIGDVKWFVPKGVGVTSDVRTSEGLFTTWASGTDVSKSFEASASLSAKYLGFSGAVSGSYSTKNDFSEDRQYAMFDYTQTLLQASLADYGDNVNVDILKREMANVGPFDPKNSESVQNYREMFQNLGSHIVVGTTYGGRLTLTVWSDNADKTQREQFEANVTASYNGLVAGGKFDASVKGSDQYKTFMRSRSQAISCEGGDVTVAGQIVNGPEADNIYALYSQWVKSSVTNPNLTSVKILALWELLAITLDPALTGWAREVRQAFVYVSNNPVPHRTKARLVIDSDWGDLALTSPAAYILPDPSSKSPPGTTFSLARVSWGTQNERPPKVSRVQIDCIIQNNGSPVDITLSHGSTGSASTTSKGSSSVEFEGYTYANVGNTDDVWNARSYLRCPVNPLSAKPTAEGILQLPSQWAVWRR